MVEYVRSLCIPENVSSFSPPVNYLFLRSVSLNITNAFSSTQYTSYLSEISGGNEFSRPFDRLSAQPGTRWWRHSVRNLVPSFLFRLSFHIVQTCIVVCSSCCLDLTRIICGLRDIIFDCCYFFVIGFTDREDGWTSSSNGFTPKSVLRELQRHVGSTSK